MDTIKIKTLEQVQDAQDAVEEARAAGGLLRAEVLRLENAAVRLRNVERAIIRLQTNELIASLQADTTALKKLITEMKQSAGKLAAVADALQKAARVVEAFIKIVTTAAAAGLV